MAPASTVCLPPEAAGLGDAGASSGLVVWHGIAVTYSRRCRSGGRCSEGVFVAGDAVE